MNVDNYLKNMTKLEVKLALDQAVIDLRNASENAYNSEWHESCFAATILLAQEYNKRYSK